MSRARAPLIILLVLTAVYLANCFTPLRLTHDTVRYITIKEWNEAGRPAGDNAATEFLPYGYVWFLMALEKIGLARSVVITFIQLLYFLGSVWFIKKIFGDSIKGWQLLALSMLSWASLKFVITPLSEMQFLFFSMGALYFFHKRGWLWAIVFTALAMLTRTIGFVLIIAFAISLLKVTSKWVAGGAVALVVVLFFVFGQFGIGSYLSHHSGYFEPLQTNPAGFFANNFRGHLIDWSALVLNAPAPRINLFGKDIIYLVVGAVSFALLVFLVLKKEVALEIKAYLICYSLIILNWPLFEPRLWVPIFPLCIAVILQHKHFALSAYKVVYIVVGVIALGYYTYTSFNKKVFAVKQDVAIWRNEYETYFFGKPLSDTAKVVREPIVTILKRYD
ncbi:MAG TPA: hypothetical protein VEB42_14305 [Chitinophagaceae bacterium]|nr:hypothetical protein [Chitinophagaceae bacterium]